MNHNTSAQCHIENGEVFMTDQSGNGHHLKKRTMKKLSETYKELGIGFTFPIRIWNTNGHQTYYEDSNGYWDRYEWDDNGRATYFEESDGYWSKYERDADGNETYYENINGVKRGTPRSAKTCEGKVVEVDGIKYKLTAL